MFLLPRRQIWTQQPQGAVEIDWQTSRDFGISAVYLGSSPGRLLVGGAVPIRSASIVDIVSDKGKAASFNYVNDESIQIGNTADEVLGGAATTIAVLRRCRDTTNRASELFAYDDSGVNRCLSHAPYSDGNIYWDFADSIAGSGRLSAAYTKDTAWETLVFVAGQSKGREIWRRGIRMANNAAAKAIRSSSTLPFLLGASGVSSDNVDVALFVVSPNEWTDAQIRQWSENPWQIFKRPDSRIFVPVSAGGSVNATAYGSFSPLSLTPQTAGASGSASASGSLAAITLSAPTATASAGGSANASGSFAAISISPATATATATTSATASGAFAVVSLSAPTATATGTTAGGANATCTPAQITISHAAAIAIGSAVASGGYQSIGITAPTGTASVGNGNATASGAWAAISITAPTAYASNGFIRAPAGRGPTVIQAGSYRPSNTGGRRY